MKQTPKSYMIEDFLQKRSARTPIQHTSGGMYTASINHLLYEENAGAQLTMESSSDD